MMLSNYYYYYPNIQCLNQSATFQFPQYQISYNFTKAVNKRKCWTKEEDEELLNLVHKYGPQQWKAISEIIKSKSAKQCRDHYFNCLDPNINTALWTNEEEKILLKKYKQYGAHWSKIRKYLPGRTPSMIKAYLQMLLRRSESKKKQIMTQRPLNEKNRSSEIDMTMIQSLLNNKEIDFNYLE